MIMKLDKLFEEEMKDPEFAAGFAEENEKLTTAYALYEAREKAGLTQAELAERANTTQATIARIERGDNVSVDKLSSIARALGKRVRVSLV